MTAPTPDDLKAASQTAVLSGLNPRAVQTLLASATVIDLEPGEALFRQNEPAAAFFIVIYGWIKLYRITPAGDEAVLHVLTKGESFAGGGRLRRRALPCDGVRRHRVPGRADTRAPRDVLHPRDAGYRYRNDRLDVAAPSSTGSARRATHGAKRSAAGGGVPRRPVFQAWTAPARISLPYDKSLIAGRLGLKPESLSRVFAKFRQVGVDVRASDVVVSEVAQLRNSSPAIE